MDFTTERIADPHCPGKTLPVKRHRFNLDGIEIVREEYYKCLGVLVDQQLDWKVQTAATVAKGTKWVSLF